MYAVVAPGISCVYTNWKDVERIKALYPYPKWYKCRTEEEAYEWLSRNTYGHGLGSIRNYGNTFKDLYVDVKYRIDTDCVFYILDCRRLGKMRLNSPDALIEYKGNKIYVKISNIYLSDETIAGHMSVLHNLLTLVGPYVDLNIELPYYSIFYCLTVYSKGNNRHVRMVQSLINERVGAVAYSLRINN